MRKLIGLLAAGLTISVFVAGCSKPPEGDNVPPSTTTSTTTTPTNPTTEPGKMAPTPEKKTVPDNAAPTTPSKPSPGGAPSGATGTK